MSDGEHGLPACCCERAGLTGTPPSRWCRRSGSPHRENWPEVGVPLPARRSAWWLGRHAPVQRPRGAFCDSASAPEVEKSGRTVSAIPMYGSRRTLGFPPRRNHLGTGGPSRRPPTAGCADQRSAFPCLRVAPPGGLGAMRQFSVRVAPSATRRALPRYEKSGRTVSAIPMYGSHRTLGFPPRRNHLATGGPSRRPPTAGCAGPHRENWPEVGVPLPARRSAWWLGRHAPVQRPRGAFCDSASAPEVEKSGRTVSAIPMYGSRRTLGFPPRRNHLATGGPSRRPPTAGCADQRSAFPCLRVAPPGEKSGRTVSAIPMYGSHRTLGFPPRRNHLATGGPSRRPPTAGCAGPPGELARGRRSLACASLRLVAWAPCASSASAWRLLRLGERSRG